MKNGATLTIQPGTFIIGQPGIAAAFRARDCHPTRQIIAKGTKSRPIMMTSSQPFGQRQRGDWGGLLLHGQGPGATSWRILTARPTPPGTFYLEGLTTSPDTLYGGTDPKHNCGTLEYVRVEYAGSILSPNNETQLLHLRRLRLRHRRRPPASHPGSG